MHLFRLGLHVRIMVAAILLYPQTIPAQSLTGTTGLVSIPTAQMPADGTVAVGVNLIDRRYHDSPDPYPGNTAMVQYASIGFLPFAEVGLRLTRMLDRPRAQALGDRMVSVRLRLLRVVHRLHVDARGALLAGGNGHTQGWGVVLEGAVIGQAPVRLAARLALVDAVRRDRKRVAARGPGGARPHRLVHPRLRDERRRLPRRRPVAGLRRVRRLYLAPG